MASLPYQPNSMDMVVIDPPYRPRTAKLRTAFNKSLDERYRLGMVLKTQAQVLDLYQSGMVEAKRVLRGDGILAVKCQDAVESRKQCWMHIDIYQAALWLDFVAEDLFVLISGKPPIDSRKQQHARKNHSFMWVFRRSDGQG
ncbi:MAG: hypothetical protein ABIH46_00315 [Chloroflexota bacterium]